MDVSGRIKWDVIIEFKDGAYSGEAIASTKEAAYSLCLQDARMASASCPQYVGPVVAKFVTKSKK